MRSSHDGSEQASLAPASSWIGRQAEAAALGDAIAQRRSPIVLVGPPGVGLTSLVTRVLTSSTSCTTHALRTAMTSGMPPLRDARSATDAHDASDGRDASDGHDASDVSDPSAAGRPVDAVVRVSVSGCATFDEVLTEVAFGAGQLDGHAELAAVERDRWLERAGRIVLVIDDADRWVEPLVEWAETWARTAREPVILLVSRCRPALLNAGARTWRLDVEPLPIDDAIALLLQRARQVSRGWGLASDPALLALLCDEVDRLPLAIEVLASSAGMLSPSQLLARLGTDGSEILPWPNVFSKNPSASSASLQASIEPLWNLVGDRAQRALMRCAVFPRSFSLELAEAVLSQRGALTLLHALLSRSLIERVSHGVPTHEMRFRVGVPVRFFALQQLTCSGERLHVEACVDAAVVTASEVVVRSLEGPYAASAQAHLELERDSLEQALHRGPGRDAAISVRAGLVLNEQSVLDGAHDTSIQEATLRAARRQEQPDLLARSLVAMAVASARMGQIDEPVAQLDQAVALLEGHPWQGRALLARGRYHAQHGGFDRARLDLARAREALGLDDDPWALGCVRNVEGCVAEILGELEAAVVSFEAARTLFRRCGSQRMEAAVVGNIGVVRHAQGRLEDARSLTEQALDLARGSENLVIEADSLLNLGSWHLTAGQLDEAIARSTEALSLQRRLGNRRFEGLAMANLAMAAHDLGDLRGARDRYQRAIEILHACGEARFEALVRPFFAAAEASLGLLSEARADFAAARETPAGMDAASVVVVDVLEGILLLTDRRAPETETKTHVNAEADAGVGGGIDVEVEVEVQVERAANERLERGERQLATAPDASREPELVLALRLLRAALARCVDARTRPNVLSKPSLRRLVLGPEARWFTLDSAGRVDLARRGPLHRLLRALATQLTQSPGVGMAPLDLFHAGWPGERVRPQAAVNRVYTAIKTLRQLGLEQVLMRQDDGYLLATDIELVDP